MAGSMIELLFGEREAMSELTELAGRVAEEVAATVAARAVQPGATYRLQFGPNFTFCDAAQVVPYLRALGITHVYTSPYLQARPGSAHGYDVCNHDELSSDLGGAEGYAAFVQALRDHQMGQILDVVPNHMSTSTENAWWNDVLENGLISPYATFFDIDWRPVKTELANKVLLPILGQQYGEVLESGQLRIEHQGGVFLLRYFDHVLPMGPKTTVPIMVHRIGDLRDRLGEDSTAVAEFESILTSLEHLPPQTAISDEAVIERHREKEVIKRRLRELEAACPEIQEFIDRNLEEFNGTPDDPASFDSLDAILNAQPYRLSYWRVASDEINYRRFFDINELAALCMESPEVFWRTHGLVTGLAATGDVAGLRIDHIDGLYAPEQYLWRLQWAYLAAVARVEWERLVLQDGAQGDGADGSAQTGGNTANENGHRPWETIGPTVLFELCRLLNLPSPDGSDWAAIFGPHASAPVEVIERARSSQSMETPREANGRLPLYVLVEKILGPNEPLPESWPAAGTTGYDFIADSGGLMIDPAGWGQLKKHYGRFSGQTEDFDAVVRECKLSILRVAMASELQMLAHRLNCISEQHRRSRDFTLNMLRFALREILVCFPVYRVYASPAGVSDRDRRFVQLAVALAKRRNPAVDLAVFDFIRDVVLLEHPPGLSEEARREREEFAGKFQQVTSPVMAKGVEDTAFYVYFPLLSANEVGCDPRHAVTLPAAFHEHNVDRRLHRPESMLASSTHDSKRSEDVRARLDVLSEIPRDWQLAVNRWARLNRRKRREVDGQPAPSRNDEYLFYQSLLGIWPPGPVDAQEHWQLCERLQAYMEKATREAKQRTSWINPNQPYDHAIREFVSAVLQNRPDNKFLADFRGFHAQIVPFGLVNALAQLVLKLMSPGVPDIYQGQELWDLSLVDPDSRRPIDFDLRRRLLDDVARRTADANRAVEAGRATGGRPASEGGLARRDFARELAMSPADPRLKLYVTRELLALRRALEGVFSHGEYVSLKVGGAKADHVVAFARTASRTVGAEAEDVVLVVVPRLLARLVRHASSQSSSGQSSPALPLASQSSADQPLVRPEVWDDTAVEVSAFRGRSLHNVFTGAVHMLGETIPLAELFGDFPVAVLTSRRGQ
jgi:(1->4)-alpha-D-glucan 1-alpha-D-glucosylmutase